MKACRVVSCCVLHVARIHATKYATNVVQLMMKATERCTDEGRMLLVVREIKREKRKELFTRGRAGIHSPRSWRFSTSIYRTLRIVFELRRIRFPKYMCGNRIRPNWFRDIWEMSPLPLRKHKYGENFTASTAPLIPSIRIPIAFLVNIVFYQLATKAQAWAMKAMGAERITEIKRRTLQYIFKKTRSRGWDPSSRPLVFGGYIIDSLHFRRKAKITREFEQRILKKVTKDRSGREKSCAYIAVECGCSTGEFFSAMDIEK
jgi:hypothetical protein